MMIRMPGGVLIRRSSVIALPVWALFLLLSGCAPESPARAPSGEVPRQGEPAPTEEQEARPAGDAPESPNPLLDDREPEPDMGLPELTYTHLGMHIGGEPNDAASKRPWLEAIERGDDEILRCYRFVDEPLKGGSYGVDLFVTTRGGAPEVRAARQKIGGAEFETCMKAAFEAVNFAPPERPTVLSYSILFKMNAR